MTLLRAVTYPRHLVRETGKHPGGQQTLTTLIPMEVTDDEECVVSGLLAN